MVWKPKKKIPRKRGIKNLIEEFNRGYKTAIFFFDDGDIENAIKSMNDALQIYPDSPKAWANLGFFYAKKGDHVRAIECYHKALKLKTALPQVFFNLGMSYMEIGDYKEAINSFISALKYKPNHTKAIDALTLCFIKTGNIEKAKRLLHHYIKNNPADETGFFRLAQLEYTYYNSYSRAVDNLKKSVKLNPAYIDAWKLLGQIYYENGHFDFSLSAWNHVLRIDPDNISALIGIANCYKSLNRPLKAIEFFSMVLDQDKNNSEALYKLGVLYNKIGNTEKAINFIERYLRIVDDTEAKKLLEKIRNK